MLGRLGFTFGRCKAKPPLLLQVGLSALFSYYQEAPAGVGDFAESTAHASAPYNHWHSLPEGHLVPGKVNDKLCLGQAVVTKLSSQNVCNAQPWRHKLDGGY